MHYQLAKHVAKGIDILNVSPMYKMVYCGKWRESKRGALYPKRIIRFGQMIFVNIFFGVKLCNNRVAMVAEL